MPGHPEDAAAAVARLPLHQACRALQDQGWVVAGTGDWAVALADPTDSWCLRLAPVDPAYRLFADDVLAGPPNRWLPRIVEIVPLAGEGYAVLMERLRPVDPSVGQGFCDALGLPDDTGDAREPGAAAPRPLAAAPDLDHLRCRVRALLARGAARYPRLWGGSDVRAGNVMADAGGALKLVDPVFLSGPRISAALLAGDPAPLADLSRPELEAFLTLPCFHREHDRYDGVEELRAALTTLELTR